MKIHTRTKRLKGGNAAFTLTEMTAAMLIMAIVILGMGLTFVDSSRGWARVYGRACEGVVADAFAARRAFDSIARRSVMDSCSLAAGGDSIVLFYYNDSTSASPDRYARFYLFDDELRVERGDILDDAIHQYEYSAWSAEHYSATGWVTLAGSVTDVGFSANGACVRMILKLDDGTVSMTVTTSANRHNRLN